MKAKLITLKSWVLGMSGSPKEQKEEASLILQVGVATIYRWIKKGDVFLEDSGTCSDGEDRAIIIWEMKKLVN
jgi:hypothetical protein|tara:strand:- start:423 stop:641 length:219 start_codon:yes stop_codon:yes gene_type:complete